MKSWIKLDVSPKLRYHRTEEERQGEYKDAQTCCNQRAPKIPAMGKQKEFSIQVCTNRILALPLPWPGLAIIIPALQSYNQGKCWLSSCDN